MSYFNSTNTQISASSQLPSIALKKHSISLGRDPNASSIPLESPTVSRHHATIEMAPGGRYILYDHSTNGTFIDGQRVLGSATLADGAKLQIGPFTLLRCGDRLQVVDWGDRLRLDANSLVVQQRGNRRLDDISMVIEPGQFVALVGGSGAGKSTLLRTLLGIERVSQGEVSLNGDDLRHHFNIYRTQIGYVPQDDITHQDLTVTEVLTYAALLRLPPDTDVKEIVQKTLEEVEMSHQRHALVKHLSGGQRKRVSIGVELLADPKLLFLDEPTSGLDPGLDRRIMQLLRGLADSGRTVVLVTHATSNITLCDRVAFLGQGGRLCYFGPPEDCLKFFSVKDDFALIYNQLETAKNVELQALEFRASTDYRHYISTRLRNRTPSPKLAGRYTQPPRASAWRQLGILASRYLQVSWRDRLNLAIALATAPVGISLIAVALANKDPFVLAGGQPDAVSAQIALQVLFTFSCAALWVGLSSSLPEIVKESAIYLRERLVNLNLLAYIGSKVGVLSVLALWQTTLMVAAISFWFKSPIVELVSWSMGLAVTSFLTLLASFSLGLLVSAFVKNVKQANSTLPLLLLPQIIFSGVLFKLEGATKAISWLTISRWSIGAYGAVLNLNSMIPEPTKMLGKTIFNSLENNPAYDATWTNLLLNWMLLCLHSAIYLLVAYLVQKRKDFKTNN